MNSLPSTDRAHPHDNATLLFPHVGEKGSSDIQGPKNVRTVKSVKMNPEFTTEKAHLNWLKVSSGLKEKPWELNVHVKSLFELYLRALLNCTDKHIA